MAMIWPESILVLLERSHLQKEKSSLKALLCLHGFMDTRPYPVLQAHISSQLYIPVRPTWLSSDTLQFCWTAAGFLSGHH